MRHIGVLMHSFEGAALCFREACLEGTRKLGPHRHPEITMTGVAMDQMMDAWERLDLPVLRGMFAHDMAKLAAAGAEFFVCPDNTAHIALEADGVAFPIPCLHIAEVVADHAAASGFRKIGVLGTMWTMTGPVYPGAFARRGLGWAIPSGYDRQRVHDVFFEELCLGTFADRSRREFVAIIERLAADGCDAVALVCTEIPLLVTADVSPLPILDSTRLLARAAVAVALGEKPFPGWRGGPLAAPAGEVEIA